MGLPVALIGPNHHSPHHGEKCLKRLQVVAAEVAADEEDQARAVEAQPVWLLLWHLPQHMLSSRIILHRLEWVLWLCLLVREALDQLGWMSFELARTLPACLYEMW
jgi:hypothetical protein